MRLPSALAFLAALPLAFTLARSSALAAQDHRHETGSPPRHRMTRGMPMLQGMEGVVPPVAPFLPGAGIDPSTLPAAKPRELVKLEHGDTLDLTAMLVRRTVNGKTFTMYGFNGQYPGPLISVRESTTVTVRFRNAIDLPSSVHWHGIRVDNRFDGVPGLTQDPVAPGQSFTYELRFPDAGIFWYHPHVREDIQQDMGLYGNLLVAPRAAGHYPPAHREEVLMLDDLVIEGDSLIPYGREASNYTLMGRFGTVFLVNGESHYHMEARRGEVVRFYLTNVSNTRIFNLSFGDDADIKVIGSDLGRFEREQMVPSVLIAPAERYIVDVRFRSAGTKRITNRVQALDHYHGEFFPEVDTLGMVEVSSAVVERNLDREYATLRDNADVKADIDRVRSAFEREPDYELSLTVEVKDLPIPIVQFMTVDTAYFRPIEWSDAMPDMNWVTTGKQVRWIARDRRSGKENMDVRWQFRQGDVVKVRIVNERRSFHPMSHPIHLHGQRVLVVAQDGVRNTNLVWKDTVLLPVGSTTDLVVEMSNPGRWMLHCHIAEHLDAGMMTEFDVTARE